MLPLTTPEVLDEDKAIQELSMGHHCLIQLRCLLKGMNWNNNSLQQRVDTLSGRALQGFQVGLSFLTSASSKTLDAGSSNPMPNVVGLSDPVLNANFNNKRERSTATGGTNSTFSNKSAKTSTSGGTNTTFSNKRAKASASGDINSSDKGKRISDLDSWTKTADPDHDGLLWAKYSQRPIKGRKHPRNYYKCKHIGCSAAKKVQQCENTDPPMFYVTYDNEHTCNAAAGIAPLPSTPAAAPPPPVATPPPPLRRDELRSPINPSANDGIPNASLQDTISIAKDYSAEASLWGASLRHTQNDLDILKMLLESEIDCDSLDFATAKFLEQAAPDSRKTTASPAFHFSSASGSWASGSCPSLSLNDNSFLGELNSRPSNSDFSSST